VAGTIAHRLAPDKAFGGLCPRLVAVPMILLFSWAHTKRKSANMALTDTKLRNLKPSNKAYQEADEGGLFVEIMPGGAKVWRTRYRL